MFKNLYIIAKFTVILLSVLIYSCVDDDAFFQEENIDSITPSFSVVTILNNFNRSTNLTSESDQCFQFSYPITLGYNTDATIVIDNYLDLIAVISSQSENFNITGLEFPVTIMFNEGTTKTTIENENSLLSTVSDCTFNTLREEFDLFFDTCFTFDYPVTLVDINQNETQLNSSNEFTTFYQNQGVTYQPDFVFPINLITVSNQEKITIATYFEFYSIIEACEIPATCPELEFSFEITDSGALEYLFEASFSNLEETASYSWFLNGNFIELDGPGSNGDNILTIDFNEPGINEVCILAETANCPEGVTFCREIDVDFICPELFFTIEQQGPSLFNFIADFENIETTFYQWSIDNEFIEPDGGEAGDNMLAFEFSPGIFEICIRTETPDCPTGTTFCMELVVE